MQSLNKILFIASPDGDDSHSFRRAITLADSNQASLKVVSVISPPPGYYLLAQTNDAYKGLLNSEVAHSKQQLKAKCDDLQADANLKIEVDVLIGKISVEIVKEVLRDNHDLVIKSSEDEEHLKAALFGSADMNLMRKCPCPVLIVKPSEHEHFRGIVAAMDKDDDAPENHQLNLKILEISAWLALAESSELHIVHAWELPFESMLRSPRGGFTTKEVDAMVVEEEQERVRWLEETLAEFAIGNEEAVNYLSPQLHTVKGHASRSIPEKTRELDADLIVMGTVGRVGIPGFFMGNTAETILQEIECSGLAIKPPGFKSPLSL